MSTRHLAFWPPGTPQSLTLPATSLWYNLEVSATRFPEKPATVFYDSVVTYGALKRDAERLAGFLQSVCGVKRGDRVCLYLQNSPQYVIGYYAILRADAVVVPINPMSVTGELSYLLADSGARTVIVAQDRYDQLQPLLAEHPELRAVVVTYADHLTTETELAVPAVLRAPRIAPSEPGVFAWANAVAKDVAPGPHVGDPDDLCVLPYTSGTTGHPKACMHTHRSVMHVTAMTPVWHRQSQDDVALTVLPLFHVTGMQNAMNAPIYAGATMTIMARWDRAVAAALIARYKVTCWTSVPVMVVDLLSSPDLHTYDLSSLKLMNGGGAAMPEAVATKLKELCGLTYLEGYGLSETMAATHLMPPHHPKKQCLGVPTFHVDSRVVNPETLEEVAAEETGEVVTHGPQVMKGYWNKPEANARAFVEIDGKRFLRTGDLAKVDEEGYFFMIDRVKRMINASGFKVWPAEVETLLYAHPAIQEATVISQSDPRRGETVKAVVVLVPALADTVDEPALIEWARTQMAAYKVPRSFEFVAALPRSGTGKILWRTLQEQEDARSAARATES
ncbi:MAG: long-chain fatty acid--CoA ligase [Polyangiales bacterium]